MDWSNNAGTVNINVGVPVSVNATVILPAKTVQQVLEGGESLESNNRVALLGAGDNGVQVNVGSGSYSFTVKSG